jgi:hypothetical protein
MLIRGHSANTVAEGTSPIQTPYFDVTPGADFYSAQVPSALPAPTPTRRPIQSTSPAGRLSSIRTHAPSGARAHQKSIRRFVTVAFEPTVLFKRKQPLNERVRCSEVVWICLLITTPLQIIKYDITKPRMPVSRTTIYAAPWVSSWVLPCTCDTKGIRILESPLLIVIHDHQILSALTGSSFHHMHTTLHTFIRRWKFLIKLVASVIN